MAVKWRIGLVVGRYVLGRRVIVIIGRVLGILRVLRRRVLPGGGCRLVMVGGGWSEVREGGVLSCSLRGIVVVRRGSLV